MRPKSRIFWGVAVFLCLTHALTNAQSEDADSTDKKNVPATVAKAAVDPATGAAKPSAAHDSSLVGYTIGEQDVLEIAVWKEKEMSVTAVVRPDGMIDVPLINEVYVVGMTPFQLQALLVKKLEPFVTVPEVTVTVREINSRKVYILGQVAHPGVFHINSTTTVGQVIAQAGGLRDFAKRKKIYILRNEDNHQVRLPFNYDAVIKGQKDGQDFVLRPGDTIVVP
jgi:polysaccharide biosynthesis/export protein